MRAMCVAGSPMGKAMAICSGMSHTEGKDWPPLGVL